MAKLKFLGVNEVWGLQYTYCDTVDENIMYVQIEGQSDTRKTPQDVVLMFTKEQVVEIYKKMLEMEKTNSEFLK